MSGAPVLPVAEQWFTRTRLSDEITLIQEPYADPLLSANSWHIRGTRHDLLIDAGLGVASMRDMTLDIADREPVVVLTHAHLDHMGSAHEFAQCWGHPAEPFDAPGRGSLSGPRLGRILGMSGPDADQLPDLLVRAVPRPGYDVNTYALPPVRPTRALHDGDTIDLGDRSLDVLHLPGHTAGSIALYERETQTMYSGDVVYDGELLDSLADSDPRQYVESLRRLLTLDITTVHAGHDQSLDGEQLLLIIEGYLASATASR
jgi:glyoxylase-like metal-dependent hydrolase (beta-lactamase superfamily II)